MIIISNTSPISNLAAIGQLTLLQQLYGNIIIKNDFVAINQIISENIELIFNDT
jgi:predicted nucleic acid-binding protein